MRGGVPQPHVPPDPQPSIARCRKPVYTPLVHADQDAPFVYRLGREIFILERRVRLP